MISKQFLEEEYVINGRTASDIGKQIGYSDGQVRFWVHKHGLPIHPRGGRLKTNNLIDKRFGLLTVLSQTTGNGTCAVWLCKCDCGNTKIVSSANLRHGYTKSCGLCKIHVKYGDITKKYIEMVKRNAKKRKLSFEYTPDELWELYQSQNGKCIYSNIELCFGAEQTASLDRIDSSKGYIKGNVQWIHKDINQMKWSLTENKFLEYIRLIYLSKLDDSCPVSS